MFRNKLSSVVAASLFTGMAVVGISAPAANAADCKGASGSEIEATDPAGGTWRNIKMNSCAATSYNDALTATGGAPVALGALGSKFKELGPFAGAVGAWAWGNQVALSECLKPGTGIEFKAFNSNVMSCKAQ